VVGLKRCTWTDLDGSLATSDFWTGTAISNDRAVSPGRSYRGARGLHLDLAYHRLDLDIVYYALQRTSFAVPHPLERSPGIAFASSLTLGGGGPCGDMH